MAVTNYFTIDGEIIGEETGGTQTDYLTDALGSVTATVNQSAQVVNTYTYKPYGEQLAKTGAGADPKFGWVGSLGYRKTSRRFSEQYVRARHYGTLQGQWTTKDPLYEERLKTPYTYVSQNLPTHVDPSGLRVESSPGCKGENWGGQGSLPSCYSRLRDALNAIWGTPRLKQVVAKCFSSNAPGEEYLRKIKDLLDQKSSKTLCLFCRDSHGGWGIKDPGCQNYLENLCFSWTGFPAHTVPPLDIEWAWVCGWLIPVPGKRYQQSKDCLAKISLNGKHCDCVTMSCYYNISTDPTGQRGEPGCCYHLPIHELLHCVSGYSHMAVGRYGDWLYKAAGCLCKELFGKSASDCTCAKVTIQ